MSLALSKVVRTPDLALHGEGALALVTERRYDVIFLDVEMPGMDGYSFIRELRKHESSNGFSVPAIALTAHARPEDHKRALHAGFQAHLAKPVDPAELARVLSNLVKRK